MRSKATQRVLSGPQSALHVPDRRHIAVISRRVTHGMRFDIRVETAAAVATNMTMLESPSTPANFVGRTHKAGAI